jgi:DNA-binding transcriptional ArsR family regulator
MNTKKFDAGADKAAGLMKALSNAARLTILCRLHAGECAVGTLQDCVGLSQSALSQHLARLRKDGLVATRREAQTIYYRIADDSAIRIIRALYALYCLPSKKQKRKKQP